MSLGTLSDPSASHPLQGPKLWLLPLQGVGDFANLSARELCWGDELSPLQASRYKHSRAALRQVLAGELRCEPAVVPLHSPPGGPPCLAEGIGHISLSHSGDGLLIGYAQQPIGVDLEPARRSFDARILMRRFFPTAEQAQLELLVGDGLREAVLTSWVLKEAAIKWRHRSLAAELSQWCYDHRSGRLQHQGDGVWPECRSAVTAGWRWAAVGAGCQGLDVDPQSAAGIFKKDAELH
ncbi:MAG: 4'-phosphopantetheinyl transferase superfamily protein [Cyanobium sp.]